MGAYDIATFEHVGLTITIVADDSPENPRRDYDHIACLTQLGHGYNQPGGETDTDDTVYEAWSRPTHRRGYGYSQGHPYGHDDQFVERVAKAMLGAIAVGWTYTGGRDQAPVFGYITRAQMEKAGFADGDAVWLLTAEAAQEILNQELEEYRAWAEGEVYGYEVTGIVHGERVDESCYGMYEGGDDGYVEREARGVAEIALRSAQEAAGQKMADEVDAIERVELGDLLLCF